ncbi:hypothetical protein BVX97_04045 [bacterium E08(2017)]|nr:hypothetical protein BVX97_04045 [bacterium E08(2017)]
MPVIVTKTRAYCNNCEGIHDAELVRSNGNIDGVVYCPDGKYSHRLSSKAELYLKLRDKGYCNPASEPPESIRFMLNYMSITNACNFSCTVCAANACSEEDGNYLDVEEICERARGIVDDKRRFLQLFGGEPTIHPELKEIIARLFSLGLRVGITSNGYLLGKDPQLAVDLKQSGLERVFLQFDSQDKESLDTLKRGYPVEKKNAIDNVLSSGLDLGLNCIVTKTNLEETPNLLSHGLGYGCQVKNMVFSTAADIGRHAIESNMCVDRETIVESLLGKHDGYELSLDDISPLPSFSPWRGQIHPDCGVHVVFIRTPRKTYPFNQIIDIDKLYSKMSKCSVQSNGVIAKSALPWSSIQIPFWISWLESYKNIFGPDAYQG